MESRFLAVSGQGTHFSGGNAFWHNTDRERHCASLCAAGAVALLRSGLLIPGGTRTNSPAGGNSSVSGFLAPLYSGGLRNKTRYSVQISRLFIFCAVSLISMQPLSSLQMYISELMKTGFVHSHGALSGPSPTGFGCSSFDRKV